ncbi:MAG TPA: asparagine synthase (glutamine-hydrolyzing) [Rugosimonospora sp.]
MCGIAGWVDFTRDLSGEAATVAAMTATMTRRGPDGGAVWAAPHAVLGHRRLSVIDPTGGQQPMLAVEDGRVIAAISYCSEVYNHRELRRELVARGHRFESDCDTETVLRAYLEWGEDFVDRLNGMYAFAIWDVRREALVLVRDRFGIKPLYYQRGAGGVLFGTEPKALLAHPSVAAVVDTDGLRELLSLAATPGHGGYAGVDQLRPGEMIRVDRAGLHRRTYWRLPAGEHTDDLPRTVQTVRGLLEEIVSSQLVSDVPVGVLLSGGLDSSVVAALATAALRERGGGRLRTFSLDFAGYVENFQPDYMRDTPDAPYVRQMVEHLGSRHTDVVVSTAELADPTHRAVALDAIDLPYGRGDRDTALYLLCREVGRHATVAITGESADEVFGGYAWYHDPVAVAAPTFPWLGMFGHVNDDGPDSATSLLDPGLLKQLDLVGYRDAMYRDALAEVPHTAEQSGPERRMRELTYLGLTRLMPLLLDRAERMSSAGPVEARVPFLDHRLVEYVFTTPWAMKTFDGREKSLLRAATRDLLPTAVADRRKAPFPATQDPEYERALRVELRGLLERDDARLRPLLNLDRVRQAAAAPVGPRSGNEARAAIELVLRLDAWLERYHVRLDLAD